MKDWEKRRDEHPTMEGDPYWKEAAGKVWNASRLDTLREMEPVIEALRFYADDKHWSDQIIIPSNTGSGVHTLESYRYEEGDRGKKASEALALYAEAVGEK